MYLGIDFLIDRGRDLYLSEINTGVPAGAFEYDLVYRQQFGKPSGIFDRLDRISQKNFSLSFNKYIISLPYIEELRKLKVWMDGRGEFPADPPPELKLEDKWIQYRLLSGITDMLPTEIYDGNNKDFFARRCPGITKFVLKRRLGRNGRGMRLIKRGETVKKMERPLQDHIIQPWIDSSADGLTMSIRAAVFCGEFICMFASLSTREVSNHGYRFYIQPGEKLGLSSRKFKLLKVKKKSREAEILFGDDLPGYLEEAVTLETISDGKLMIPHGIYSAIKKSSALINQTIMKTDLGLYPDQEPVP